MEFRKTIFQAWIVMENSKSHEKSWKAMEKSHIMSWNFYNCTEKFCNECEQRACRQFSLLQPAGTVATNSGMHSYVMFRLFRKKCSADRSWKFISVGPGKSLENDFPKRVVTVTAMSSKEIHIMWLKNLACMVCLITHSDDRVGVKVKKQVHNEISWLGCICSDCKLAVIARCVGSGFCAISHVSTLRPYIISCSLA